MTHTDYSENMLSSRPGCLVLESAVRFPVVLDLFDGEEEALFDVALLVDLRRALEPNVRRPHLAVRVRRRPV